MKPIKAKNLAEFTRLYNLLGIGLPLTGLPTSMEVDGNLPTAAGLIPTLSQMILAMGTSNLSIFTSSAAAAVTLTSLANQIVKLTNGGAVVVTIDYAGNLVSALQNPGVGTTFPFTIMTTAATTVATPTLSGTDVTLVGTTTVTTGGYRYYQGIVTQMTTTTGATLTAGTTFVSIAQVGTTNAFTLTLATNAIVPVVGTAIFLTVTAGTLPSGWYPITRVTSATSFVILTPAGTVWTATTATLPGTTVIPSSQYTTGYPGVLAPLVQITGIMGMSAGVMVT